MLATVSLACLLSLSHVLAYSRIFQSNDDDFSFDPLFEWRIRKDQRKADLEAYLRQVMQEQQIPSALRRPQHGWPLEHHKPLALGLQRHPSGSDFAVPPSDSRFFDSPPRVVAPHLYYREAGDSEDLVQADETEQPTTTTTPAPPAEQVVEVTKVPLLDFQDHNILLVAVLAGSSTAAFVGVALLIYGVVRLQKKAKDAADVEYPAYGVTGPNKEATPTGDRRLAHSAQMYHYQLTKQQIIAMESSSRGERRGSVSEADSEDDENEEGDYTVYECPGLAPTGEMEVKNPLFQDETTPANNDQSKE